MSTDEIILDQSFWNYRWENQLTGWDIGEPSPAIETYVTQYTDKNAAILIPGCGNAHEAEMLLENGFTNITLLDIAPKAVSILKDKYANNKEIKVICSDFYLYEGKFDLIIEQTFFCTMPLSWRGKFAQKASSLLNENGRIIGVLFNREFETQGPPFGGTSSEYTKIFEPYFKIKTLETCYNSIAPRANSEVFINFIKR